MGCSHWLRCGLCQKEREELKERLKQLQVSHVLRLAVKKRRVAELQNDINKAQFWHRTYDENTMALMVERLPFVTTNPYFIVANCHAALTLELAKLVMRMCVSGSNFMDLERMLGEFHQGSFFSELKEYLQWHLGQEPEGTDHPGGLRHSALLLHRESLRYPNSNTSSTAMY